MKKETKILLGVAAGVVVLGVTAYIFRKQLKDLMTKEGRVKRKSVRLAEQEFKKWLEGKIKEGDPATMAQLRKYWREGAGVNWSDGQMINEAWSAAFISWLQKEAGAGNNFKYSTSHSRYIRESVKNRKEKNNKSFKAYRPEEVEVEVGDLVCYPRQSGVNYDKTSSYKSHCDIITAVRKTEADSIGGNISNSVSMTKVPLTKDGYIDKNRDKKGYGGYFVVIKNEA